ncbi:MAG: hypothetical protein JOZ56_01675 [Actinobacteria bacterium]|nr:hypothetical protein [Actinomycetota bacterium]
MRSLVVLLAALAISGAAGAATPAASCGQVTARLGGNDYAYRVRVVSGSVACASARGVLKAFIERSTFPHGWFCARGHSGDAWAASCARVPAGALARAYLIAG